MRFSVGGDVQSDTPETVGQCRVLDATRIAIRVILEPSGKVFWVPQSVVHENSEVWRKGQAGALVVKSWWWDEKGGTV